MDSTYKLADKIIRIITLHEATHAMCRDYRAEGIIDLTIETSQADIDHEREKSVRTDGSEGLTYRCLDDACLETLAVYRKIAEQMPFHNILLIHGSAIAVDGAAYLFIAKSGTGKSTHTRLWRELLGKQAVMVNDDKPLAGINPDGTATVYGTPWDGKHHLSTNIAVPLKAICILTRSADNHIEPVTASGAYPMLFQQVYRPSDPDALTQTLRLIDALSETVSLWRLGCNMDPDAARISYETMKGISK